MSKRIGIVGGAEEPHCVHMAELLRRRGAEVVVLDTNRFPTRQDLSYLDGEALLGDDALHDVSALYVRTVFYSLPFFELDPALGQREGGEVLFGDWHLDYTAERERQSFLTSFLRTLELRGVKAVNPIASFDLHYLKLLQLALLARAGVPVPRTCSTNDPERLAAFVEEVGRVVYKPVTGGASCQRVTDRDLVADRLDRLRTAPAIFQEEIPGLNVRVYAVGDQVVSATIIHAEDLDYRGTETGFERLDLPTDVAEMVVRAKDLCGMHFTGADLRLTPEGQYVLLECNPSAMFLGMVQATGDPIDEALADYLLG
ncbi:MAG: RimK family alpha-L-glutamate ligase [Planctomycetota bacterium]